MFSLIISSEGKILAQSGEARINPATNDDYKGEFDFVDYSFDGVKEYYDFEGQENFCGADGKPIKPMTEEDDDFFSSDGIIFSEVEEDFYNGEGADARKEKRSTLKSSSIST